MILRDAHQSGRFDATQPERFVMLARLADAADVGLDTEAVGLDMIPGWASRGRETKVLWDDSTWQHQAHDTEEVPTPEWQRGTSRRKSVEIAWALLRHRKTGVMLLRLGGHLPAHLFNRAQLAANQAALDALGPLVLRLQAEHSPDVTTASFDFNRDMRRSAARRIVREAVKDTGLHLVVPPEGTRGRRKIDAFLTDGPLATADMLPRSKGFDHRGATLASCACLG